MNNLTTLKPPGGDKYGGRAQTIEADRNEIGAISARAATTFEKAIDPKRKRVNLADMAAVEQATAAYLRECERRQELPSVTSLSGWLGYHRTAIYKFGKAHPNFQEFLENFSSLCADALEAAALAGSVKETLTIFILKSKYNYKDTVSIEAIQQPALRTVDEMAAAEIAAKYSEFADLPED